MDTSHYISEVTSHVYETSPSTYPRLVWSFYVRYLWNYEPDSWVARISYFFRVVAILLSLPTLILGLLVSCPLTFYPSYHVEIASYGIARTLGVIDDVKASTSDKSTVHLTSTPSIHVEDVDSLGTSDIGQRQTESGMAAPQHPKEFFATDTNLPLSGVDVLSPAASRPSSPTLTRKTLQLERPPTAINEEEEPMLRHRQRRTESTA
ncbi:hypothetical protein BKA70DRAFT_1369665 [Coprinopsis sp. MPI-PUGE-AT-0042]|nr:hypothetical protein BKA70DRAFT_1369665 [Coprinopsis sp. MPI-PUGE-AT-0042]